MTLKLKKNIIMEERLDIAIIVVVCMIIVCFVITSNSTIESNNNDSIAVDSVTNVITPTKWLLSEMCQVCKY